MNAKEISVDLLITFRQSLPPGLHIRNYAFKSALLRSDRITTEFQFELLSFVDAALFMLISDCTSVVIA